MLHDQHSDVSGAKAVHYAEAEIWNKRGYGIHWVINDFEGERLAGNCKKVNAWFFEIDDKPKYYQLALIEKGLIPSLIVETKHSYHTYFFAKNASKDSFEDVQKRLIHFYKSDDKIKGVLRLMRAPGYKHLKDPTEPFDCRIVWHRPEISYTTRVMRYYYPLPEEAKKTISPVHVTKDESDLFELLYNMDHRKVLEQFSGTAWVGGETYRFKELRSGKVNILVNGKTTHCFLDADGRIGACGGGPTIWQWLKWFNHDGKTIRRAIREVLGC
jgi:hypothetical protein